MRYTGEIVKLNNRGFGFIDFLDNEIFFHISTVKLHSGRGAVLEDLDVGDIVEFTLKERSKGDSAVDLIVIKKALVVGSKLTTDSFNNAVTKLKSKFN